MSDVDEKLIVKLGQRITELTEILRMIAVSLQGVEAHLRQMAISSNTAPNYQRLLSEYPTFDWASIGATVLNRDGDGVTSVEWNGQVFTRRSPSNKFQCAIWFSRHLGQDSDGCDLKDRMAVTGCFQNSTAAGCFLAHSNSDQPCACRQKWFTGEFVRNVNQRRPDEDPNRDSTRY